MTRSGTITYGCGCVNEVHPPTDALRCIFKCHFHEQHSKELGQFTGRSYYERVGSMVDGIPQYDLYEGQMEDALEDIGELCVLDGRANQSALEIGSGASMYARWLIYRRLYYSAVEPSAWGAAWTRAIHAPCQVYEMSFGDFVEKIAIGDGLLYDVILAAHVIEHFHDAPREFARMRELLARDGVLIFLIPDDTDATNPDHYWFFTEASIKSALEQAGFKSVKTVLKKIVAHENFIYGVARA